MKLKNDLTNLYFDIRVFLSAVPHAAGVFCLEKTVLEKKSKPRPERHYQALASSNQALTSAKKLTSTDNMIFM